MRTSTVALSGLSAGLVGCREDGDEGGDEPTVQEVELVVQWIDRTWDGLSVRLRSYNAQVPGPLITTRPGELLEITLINNLDDYAAKSWTRADTWDGNHDVPHMLSMTNLHLHGLDVIPHLFEPIGTSDPAAPMIAVEPEGGTYVYPFEIPADQPAGLFWYHPHHHGSTVVQAVSGMAGPLIVEGGVDEVPEVAAAKTTVIAVQDIGLFESDDPATPDLWIYEPVQNAMWQTFSDQEVTIYNPATMMNEVQADLRGGFTTGDYKVRFYLVNGEPFYREDHNATDPNNGGMQGPCPAGEPMSMPPSPYTCPVGKQLEPLQLSAAPGEVIRLRLLNGCSDLVLPLHMEGHDLHVLALDGFNFTAPRTMTTQAASPWDGVVDYSESATSLVLAPANRADLLIQAGAPGTYQLVQLAQVGEQFLAADQKVIATLTVAGDPVEMDLPTSLPEPSRLYPLITTGELANSDYQVEFSMEFQGPQNPYVGLDFMIGGEIYKETVSSREVTLGTAEEWTIKSVMTMEGHPFHIHVNPFEVISIQGVEQPPGTIMDTVWVPKPPMAGENLGVVIRTRFLDWVGKSVYHCHILPHEDAGMMQNFMITP